MLQTVKHKIFGLGEVVDREPRENGAHITVRFENGKTLKFAIPDSFTVGVMEAEGDLRAEVEAAILEKRAREQARMQELRALMEAEAPVPSARHGRTPATPIRVMGALERAFEEYLVSAGYCEYTAAGNPSTVFSYLHAIKLVLEEEGLSWYGLRDDIENIVAVYDVAGPKSHLGAKSNHTVINALKRFKEFVNA